MSQFYVGLDLGQARDSSALVVAERTVREEQSYYQVSHLERFRLGTSYPAIVEKVKTILQAPSLRRDTTLAVDATGCGKPVLDMFIKADLPCPVRGVLIHGGDSVTREGMNYRTPKRDLAAVVSVLMQSRRLKIIDSLPDSRVVVNELLNFKVKIDPLTAHDSYSAWRENQHDDYVLAIAMACWIGEYQKRAFAF